MTETFEKVSDTIVRIIETPTPKMKEVDIRDLRKELRLANEIVAVQTEKLAEATANRDNIQRRITESLKIGVSESRDIGDPIREEGSPTPEEEKLGSEPV